MKNQKILTIVLGCIIGMMLIAGGTTAFIINYNVSITPALEILDTGTQVFAKTDANVDYEGYRFKFEAEKISFTIDSASNVLELSNNSRIVPGTKYQISVCYLGEIDGSNTVYSEPIDWLSYDYLRMSNISLQEDTIIWEPVEGADYYYIYSAAETTSLMHVTTNQVDIKNLPAGQHEIYIAAFSAKTFYKQSQPSNHISVKVVQEYEPFLSLTLDVNQFLLTGLSNELYENVQIFVNHKSYIAQRFTTRKLANGQYEYSINITAIYVKDAVVEACPYPVDAFHEYHGEKTVAVVTSQL